MAKKVMKLIDAHLGIVECRVCGYRHGMSFGRGGRYHRGTWQCLNGCKLESTSNNKEQ